MPQHKKDTTEFKSTINKEKTKENEYRYRMIFPKPLGDKEEIKGIFTKKDNIITFEIVSQ